MKSLDYERTMSSDGIKKAKKTGTFIMKDHELITNFNPN